MPGSKATLPDTKAESSSDGQSTGGGQDGAQKKNSSAKSQSAGKKPWSFGALPMVSRTIPEVRKMLKARVRKKTRVHRIVKVPATARMVPTNRTLLLKAKVQGKALELPGTPDGKQNNTASPESSQGQSPGKGKSESEGQDSSDGTSGDQSETGRTASGQWARTAARIPKPDYECSRRSSGPCRSRFHS